MDVPHLPLQNLDNYISLIQNLISFLPYHLRTPCVHSLAMARFQRYMLTRQRHDLDLSILRSTEAIFLPPPWGGAPPNIIQIFFSISLTLFHRARESRRPKDVKHSVMYLRFLHNQPLEIFNVPPDLVTEVFVHALAIQVELDLGQTQDIEEMAVLCLELLDSDISITPSTDSIMALFRAIKAQFVRWDGLREPPKKAIECLREANRRLPDSHQLSIALACVLFNRFNITYSNDDYEEATAILDKVIASCPPGGQFQVIALHMVAFLAQARSVFDGKPVNVEYAIYRIRTLLGGSSVEEPFRPGLIQELARLQAIRFDDSGGIDGIQDANSCNSEYSCRPSFRDLTESLAEPNGVKSLPITTERQHLEALLSTPRFTNVTDIVEAIEYCRVWLTSYPHSGLATLAGITLCLLLLRAFSYTDKMDYLNEAISVLQDHLINPGVGRCRFMVVGLLISSVTIRFNRLYRKEDFNELMELFPVAVNDRRGRTPERFTRSCEWARTARFFGHPSASTAYDCAVSLIQDTLTFAPTLEIQHSRLVAMRHSYETLPLDSASYLVHMGRLPEAIETLERGRALLWSEMRGLRTSIDQIRAVDLHIADKFTAINRNLEMLTLTALPDGNGGEVGSFEEMEPFGRLVVEQQKLLDDRDKIISQLRTLPSFENFLKASPFDSLRSAAARGPVIIINHCIWRPDILILIHDSPSCLIHTPNDFYSRANKLRDRLLDARKKGLDSDEYEVALRVVLEELYELVGRPVIQRLSELNVPEQSRVWWCPTSAFCSLPLHAMGPIPSDDGAPRYFLDLYIPSYTPTLSALIESNKHGSKMLEKPSILLVLQPDASMEQALEEMQVVQSVNTRVTTLISATATPPAVLERLRDHRFAHIVCHGILEPGKPFDASFKLYRDKRLSLLDIVRSRLPDAEFAFLAACHTAELTDKSLADEALHLTAAMQYCGFRSVVGTMWAMADTDGQHLARNFYKSVFSGKKQGVRYYEKTARALRDAVVKLRSQRGRGMTLERWVNFVHYGA
ncbi:CHAT domain-containing protein [Russula earlei]|uniref:CHAT domain-containing protein n=1 Tax=Russula earlei TaxID=71964 RepID=A0ACC0UC57_9AGAM|nr:CHAT domain-containing protein [Russula earlei]